MWIFFLLFFHYYCFRLVNSLKVLLCEATAVASFFIQTTNHPSAFAFCESKPPTIFRPIDRIKNQRNMKFLTIDYIKQHSRIDFDCEDGELDLYGAAAENTVLSILRRTLDNIKDMHGGSLPPELYHAALLLTEQGYNYRSPVSPTNMSIVPYGFDMMVKPLMRLDGRTDLQAERDTLLDEVNDLYSDISFEYEPTDYDRHTEEEYEKYADLLHRMIVANDKYGSGNVENPTTAICARLRKEVAEIKTQCDELLKTA